MAAVEGWRAYPVEHNPFAASEAVIPEPDASIQAQHQALLDPNDPREAMLYNPGQQPIENAGLGTTRLQDGRAVQFDRRGLGALTPQKVAAYDRSNRLNELLQYGPVSKDDAIARAMAGEQPAVVTTMRNGVPVKEAAGTASTVPAQFAAQHATKGPGDTVGVTHPSSVFGRLGFQDGGALTDDNTVWPEDQPEQRPSNVPPPQRPGSYWLADMAHSLWSGATLPGDVATGKASMADPATQRRVGDMAGLVTLGAGAMPAEAGALNMGARNLNPLGFYSHGADVAAKLPQATGTMRQMLSGLEKGGVKQAEMEAAGITDLMRARPPERAGANSPADFYGSPPADFAQSPLTRDELASRFHEASPPLQETVLTSNPYPYRTAPQWQDAIDRAERAGDHDEAARISAAWEGYEGFGQPSAAKHSQWVLPGGENYREVLMHLPSQTSDAALADAKQRFANRGVDWDRQGPGTQAASIAESKAKLGEQADFKSSHFDQPNIVAHLRLNDRTGAASEADALAKARELRGNPNLTWDEVHPTDQAVAREMAAPKLLHMEELQSDWGQRARNEGIAKPIPLIHYRNPVSGFTSPTFQDEALAKDYFNRLPPILQGTVQEVRGQMMSPGVPAGPYVTNTNSWTDLGLKRALIEAARGDYTHLSWTPGADQAARYGLSKHIDELHYSPGNQKIYGLKGGAARLVQDASPDELPDAVGKEVASKLLAQPLAPVKGLVDDVPRHVLTGQDLTVGGEGMKGFYDRQVPNQLSKLAKKLDPNAKIGTSQIQTGSMNYPPTSPAAQKYTKTVPSLEITPLMRERILQGLPQYRRGGRVGFADGGPVEGLEAVDYDPFAVQPPDRTMQPTDVNRAKGFPEPRSPMHERIAAASKDEPQTWYGKWGKTLGDELGAAGPAIGEATDWGTEALGKFGANVIADPLPSTGLRTMSPESEANLAHGITGAGRELLSDPMLGEGIATAPHVAEAPRPSVGQVGSDVSAAAAPARAQIMEINGVKRHIDPEFSESRVGTSVPTKSDPKAAIDAKEAAHANNNMHVGMELAGQAPTYGKAVANMVRSDKIPYVKTAQGADDAAVQESLIEHMKDNLLGLYNRVSGAVRSGSKLWYEGANTRSRDIALTHDIPHENAAGVVASMSPQKDWDQNVTLADWVAHTAGTTAHDATMSPEMTDWVNRYALRKDPERVVTDPETGAETRFNARTGEEMSSNSVSREDVQRQLAGVTGKTWGQMNPSEKAFYTRAYYEAHGPPNHLMPIDDKTGQPAHWIDDKGDRKYGYYINNPDGTHDGVLARYGDEYVNVKGQPIPVSWGSTGEVSNAIQAFGAKHMGDISEALGEGHKVRSFYNNIIAPWSKKGDVTSDTHAVAAALLRPLGAGSPEAASGMGAASPGNADTGLKGFYPHVAEAYRRAARDAGVLPRELQSITWEALRGLWSPREKMAKSNVKKGFTSPTDATNAIWQQYKNGEISMQDAHDAILGQNGEKIRAPRWFETFRP